MMKQPVNTHKVSAYAQAGVDIDSKMSGIEIIKKMVTETTTKGVVGGIGSFGGLFHSPGKEFLLVASTDGVGTKLKVAALAKKMQELKEMSDTLLHLASHCHGDDRPDCPILTTLGSGLAEVLAQGGVPDLSVLTSPQVVLGLSGLAALVALPMLWRALRPRREGME